jgi:arylsulfate sulfotransferase
VCDATKLASASVSIIAPGTVAPANNPQVALYMITPPADANVSIQFGTDTTYGLTTWTQPALAGGGPVIIYVAGIRANTAYHTRAVVQFSGNATVNDSDHIFKTASLPAAQIPTLTAATTAGQTPQSGLELLNFLTSAIRAT